jgi:hypothetical protein
VTGIGGAQACPGKGQIHATETGAGFSVAGPVFNSLELKRKSFCFYRNIEKWPASLGGSGVSASRSSISRRSWRHEFDPPPDNQRGFSLPQSNFFPAFFYQGGNAIFEYALIILRGTAGGPPAHPPGIRPRREGITSAAHIAFIAMDVDVQVRSHWAPSEGRTRTGGLVAVPASPSGPRRTSTWQSQARSSLSGKSVRRCAFPQRLSFRSNAALTDKVAHFTRSQKQVKNFMKFC